MASRFLLPLFLLSFLSLSSALPSQTLLDAVEILSDSGFVAMALTLNLLSKTLAPQSPSLTIFSPVDAAFRDGGQPPLSLLQFHFSPLPLSLQSLLKSLPVASTIPTLLPNHSLVLTSSPSDDSISLNGVKIDGSPVFDDGSLIIFGIQQFFDPKYFISRLPNHACTVPPSADDGSFVEASLALRSKGYTVMASFLDLQLLLGFNPNAEALTIFAPLDDALKAEGYIGNVSEYPSLFRRHVVPCKFSWADLLALTNNGVLMMETFLEGFNINVTKSGNEVMINEVAAISSPDLYCGESLVVHGLEEVLEPVPHQPLAEPPSDIDDGEF